MILSLLTSNDRRTSKLEAQTSRVTMTPFFKLWVLPYPLCLYFCLVYGKPEESTVGFYFFFEKWN